MTKRAQKIPKRFYGRSALQVARSLIGLHLVHVVRGRRRAGRIVETEAYQGPEDLAAHSARGRTARNAVMFGPPGHAYVYFIYGMWHCLNVVTAAAGTPHAVLLRALEPVEGLSGGTWGPGLLCRAMGIDRRLNGADLCGSALWIEQPSAGARRAVRLGWAPRIGVDYAGAWAARPWRFFDRRSPYVSTAPRAGRAAGPQPRHCATAFGRGRHGEAGTRGWTGCRPHRGGIAGATSSARGGPHARGKPPQGVTCRG